MVGHDIDGSPIEDEAAVTAIVLAFADDTKALFVFTFSMTVELRPDQFHSRGPVDL